MSQNDEAVALAAVGSEIDLEGVRLPSFIGGDADKAEIYRKALVVLEGRTEENPLAVADLLSSVSSGMAGYPKDSYIYHLMLAASKADDSPISSRKGRAGGYFLVAEGLIEAGPADAEAVSEEEVERREKTLEKHLWPLFAEWLKSNKEIKNATHEIAHVKSGGVWGNPDVIGLRPLDRLGFFDVEVFSVEVKPELKQWRYYFFEAVAHKRFAERVYFAYRSDGAKTGDEAEILKFAEKYDIGVLRLEINQSEYDTLPNWKQLDERKKIELTEQIVEVVPAPSDPVALQEKLGLFDRIGIKSREDIYQFGL
ncbi:hypothetical protein [Pseudooceanicola sp. 200-1SW]|uniref:hypothetical protein n=1 Tax=Pseudooceanicola sp. 200-1SW TaxID=3425949 RepID=UPI003D7FD28E